MLKAILTLGRALVACIPKSLSSLLLFVFFFHAHVNIFSRVENTTLTFLTIEFSSVAALLTHPPPSNHYLPPLHLLPHSPVTVAAISVDSVIAVHVIHALVVLAKFVVN